MIGAFESTYQPKHDIDIAETTQHVTRFDDDIALLRSCGVESLRYPIRWHRVEPREGQFDWSDADRALGRLHDSGLHPIVDLVHHTSYPRWLAGGFADPRFRTAYLRYAEAVAARYPWVESYTLFNEPFSTLFLCGHEAIWPPYHRGLETFLALLRNVLPAVSDASRMYQDLLPHAQHVYVDSCEHHQAATAAGEEVTLLANDRRFFVADVFLGRHLDTSRPFIAAVVAAGFDDLLGMPPGDVDILGLDYYAHCQWDYFAWDVGVVPSAHPMAFQDLIADYCHRYRLPCMVGETNIRGTPSDRASWFKYTLEQCEAARERGVDVVGYCWFPFVDSSDWDSLLFHCDGNIDPVGVYSLDPDLERRASSMSDSFRLAATGASAAELPAYEFQQPVATWMTGFRPYMAHWNWQPPRPEDHLLGTQPSGLRIELKIRDALDVEGRA
ncbi:MAG TPA: family 1 glycosylhydrolase [Actinomycetota bacterium]|nr:family 1 glycosylhydrolase [Actinomycetota bacterium]